MMDPNGGCLAKNKHGSTCSRDMFAKKLWIPNLSNMEFLDQTAKDPEVAKMFAVLGKFFLSVVQINE